ncbi:MAG: 2-hydroxyacyl-CoA dehydratase, partial [Candidatus Dadabacteria bacterium]
MGEAIDWREIAAALPNRFLSEWKASGRPVIGHFCSHAPEELLSAAGALPVRLRGAGATSTAHADAFLGSVNCSFVRYTLERILSNGDDFLDGVVVTNSCDHIRRLCDVLDATGWRGLNLYFDLPHVGSDEARERLCAQLEALRARLEQALGVRIGEAELAAAVRLHNRTRAILRRAARLREESPRSVRASDLLALSVAASAMPRQVFNDLAEQWLEQQQQQRQAPSDSRRPGPRLLVVGGILDDPGFLDLLESVGATVVADS